MPVLRPDQVKKWRRLYTWSKRWRQMERGARIIATPMFWSSVAVGAIAALCGVWFLVILMVATAFAAFVIEMASVAFMRFAIGCDIRSQEMTDDGRDRGWRPRQLTFLKEHGRVPRRYETGACTGGYLREEDM